MPALHRCRKRTSRLAWVWRRWRIEVGWAAVAPGFQNWCPRIRSPTTSCGTTRRCPSSHCPSIPECEWAPCRRPAIGDSSKSPLANPSPWPVRPAKRHRLPAGGQVAQRLIRHPQAEIRLVHPPGRHAGGPAAGGAMGLVAPRICRARGRSARPARRHRATLVLPVVELGAVRGGNNSPRAAGAENPQAHPKAKTQPANLAFMVMFSFCFTESPNTRPDCSPTPQTLPARTGRCPINTPASSAARPDCRPGSRCLEPAD